MTFRLGAGAGRVVRAGVVAGAWLLLRWACHWSMWVHHRRSRPKSERVSAQRGTQRVPDAVVQSATPVTSVLFPVLGTSQLSDIVSNKYDIFARWERMCGTHVRHEVSKPGGDEHGSPDLLLI